jgi:poly(3-hydroxyalkanoate) synthetase
VVQFFLLLDTCSFHRLSETLDSFSRKLESVYTASGGKKINLITHSMGGLLVKCFMSLHGDVSASPFIFWAFAEVCHAPPHA